MAEQTEQEENMLIKEKKEVPRGTLILQEKPFVYVLSSKYRSECCDFCFKKQKDLLKCSACKYVHYCGKACQREGWGIHKLECKNFKKTYPRVLPDAARMLFRLSKILENGGDVKKSHYPDNGHYRTYKDLMSHYPDLKNDQTRMEHLSSLYGVLYEFSGNDLLPNSAELMGMYGRMCINSFSICNQEMQSLGSGIYLAASVIDHSCQPNAVATFEGTTLNIRTLETLPHLDWTKIRISYIDVLASTKERQNQLEKSYYFSCDCPKCQEPENLECMFGAQCPECSKCVYIGSDKPIKCQYCGKEPSKNFIEKFKEVVDFTEMQIDVMNSTTYLDVCRVCLKKHKNVLNKYHLRHVKILDLAYESCIDLQYFDEALQYGLQLVDSFVKYYPKIHPLTGLLHLKLCKLLLYKDRVTEGISHLKKATEILTITHGITSSLYKSEVILLIQQCRFMVNGVIK